MIDKGYGIRCFQGRDGDLLHRVKIISKEIQSVQIKLSILGILQL